MHTLSLYCTFFTVFSFLFLSFLFFGLFRAPHTMCGCELISVPRPSVWRLIYFSRSKWVNAEQLMAIFMRNRNSQLKFLLRSRNFSS